MKQTYSRRTGFRTWAKGKSVPIDSEQFSASTPQPSPLAAPGSTPEPADGSTPPVGTAGEASLPKVGSTWIHRETGLVVDVVRIDGETMTLRSPSLELEWCEITDGFRDEHEEAL